MVIVPVNQVVQYRRELVQAVQVRPSQLLDDTVAFPGQGDTNHTAIRPVGYAFDEPGGFGSIHELHRAMRPQEQVAGQVPDRRRLVSRMSLDRHQQLVLDVRKPRGSRLILAPPLEGSQGYAELQQPLEVPPGQPRHCHLLDL
jgi:hypothetical protein